jgi:hypothetical protein
MRDIPVGNYKAFPTMYRNDHNVPLPKKLYITEKYKTTMYPYLKSYTLLKSTKKPLRLWAITF